LFVMAQAAQQQADADHAVADDHDRRENRVACQKGSVGSARQHHREDQRHFDDRDGQRKHQRAEWFADPVRNHLGVMHGCDDCADQRGSAYESQRCPERQEKRCHQQNERDRWNDRGPMRHAKFFLCHERMLVGKAKQAVKGPG
jgi:hypothetical protein